MQVQFGYCAQSYKTLPTKSDVQSACSSAIRDTTGTATMESGQFQTLTARLTAIEGSLDRLEKKFNVL